jgi:hypothetical protein
MSSSTAELESSLAARAASYGAFPASYGAYPGYGYPEFHPAAHHQAVVAAQHAAEQQHLAAARAAEEAFVQDRTNTLNSLKAAETAEATAAEQLSSDAHKAEISLAEATEQSR